MEQVVSIEVKPVNKKKVRKLWKIAMILGVVTTIEFVMAFTLPRGYLLYAGFIALTLLKAFYIVSEFMHLKYEVKALIWSILLPTLFVIWLIIALLAEGGSILNSLY
jgi:cytochrome c oxidase subunit IV